MPVSTKMPVPMMAPMPSRVRSNALRHFFSSPASFSSPVMGLVRNKVFNMQRSLWVFFRDYARFGLQLKYFQQQAGSQHDEQHGEQFAQQFHFHAMCGPGAEW